MAVDAQAEAEHRGTAIMTEIALNARFYAHRPTGMQRYARELASRFGSAMLPLQPAKALRGMRGHLWEQFWLPSLVGNRLLFSPNNTGPLAVPRQVCTIHDLIPLDHPEWFGRRFAEWYRWLLPKLLRKVRHLIAVSHFTRNRIVERFGIHPEKITVIPNGIDARFSPRGAEEVSEVVASLGVQSSRYLLCVGSLEPRKNLLRLLGAWARVPVTAAGDTMLVVAGAPGNSRVFETVSLGVIPPRVHFTGYVSDEQLPALYSGALALVYPTLYEGFGLPPLEAMACGTPVLTSDRTSIPEVVGPAAILVDPEDADSIVDGICRVLSSARLRGELRELGLARVRDLTWERTAEATLQVLRNHAGN